MRRPEVIDAEFEVIEPGMSPASRTHDLSRALALLIARTLVGGVGLVVCFAAFKLLSHFLWAVL